MEASHGFLQVPSVKLDSGLRGMCGSGLELGQNAFLKPFEVISGDTPVGAFGNCCKDYSMGLEDMRCYSWLNIREFLLSSHFDG